ncbi:MAG: NAD(P)/FAD-dependent oxidoreductase, partial [Planctomycetota bacterium]
GLVGSLLACLLAQRGARVEIFEKRPDLRRSDLPAGRSINLALAERGLHALQLAGVMDEVRPLLIPMRGRQLHDRDGNTEFQPYGLRPEEVIYSVSRTELNRVLLDAAERHGCQTHFQQTCDHVDLEARKIAFSDGVRDQIREHAYDRVFGTDGVASVLRRAIDQATGTESRIERLDHDYKELCIPATATGTHAIEREALHIWPRGGFMLIALPNLDGSFTVTLFLPREGPVSFAAIQEPVAMREFFAREFADAVSWMPRLDEDFAENPTGPLGTVRCPQWNYRDSALLLGDASHAIVPFHGQGMNAGFEDCEVLMRSLDAAAGRWADAIPHFAETRPADAHAIAEMALENYITMRDSVTDPRFQQKKQLGFELERRFPERFVPRYSMVMFHRIPYAEVLHRGQRQDAVLERLLNERRPDGEIDLQLAESLL